MGLLIPSALALGAWGTCDHAHLEPLLTAKRLEVSKAYGWHHRHSAAPPPTVLQDVRLTPEHGVRHVALWLRTTTPFLF